MEIEELKSLCLQLSGDFLYNHEVDEWVLDTCIVEFTPAVTDAVIDRNLLGRLSRQFGDVAETVSQCLSDSLIGRSGSHIVTRGEFCHV
jgi:hypothetical protein